MSNVTVNVGTQPSKWLKEEYSIEHCRENRTMPAGTQFTSGTVVEQGASATEVVEFDPAGGNDPVGIVFLDCAADAAASGKCVIVARGPGILGRTGLVWKAGASAAEIAAGEAKLEALGFVLREQS